MRCPKYNFENPDEAKFYVECGNKFQVLCPECGFRNFPSFKFCAECGEKLIQPSESTPEVLSFDDKVEKIQKFLPKGIAEKILSQKGKIEGERKQATVMSCDMVGLTSFSEKFDAEDIFPIMDKDGGLTPTRNTCHQYLFIEITSCLRRIDVIARLNL